MIKMDIKVYTDGACSGNPGPGGWAALLLIKKGEKKDKILLKGGEKHTTNNRMELLAVIESMKFIHKNIAQVANIEIYSDSAYVINPINNGWLKGWARNGWVTTKRTDIVNKDLWLEFIATDDELNKSRFIKVKGHNGDKFNEYVDKAAVNECNKYKQLLNGL